MWPISGECLIFCRRRASVLWGAVSVARGAGRSVRVVSRTLSRVNKRCVFWFGKVTHSRGGRVGWSARRERTPSPQERDPSDAWHQVGPPRSYEREPSSTRQARVAPGAGPAPPGNGWGPPPFACGRGSTRQAWVPPLPTRRVRLDHPLHLRALARVHLANVDLASSSRAVSAPWAWVRGVAWVQGFQCFVYQG
jgi:hypothetical protein